MAKVDLAGICCMWLAFFRRDLALPLLKICWWNLRQLFGSKISGRVTALCSFEIACLLMYFSLSKTGKLIGAVTCRKSNGDPGLWNTVLYF